MVEQEPWLRFGVYQTSQGLQGVEGGGACEDLADLQGVLVGRVILKDGNSRVTGRPPGSTRICAYFTSQETSWILGGAYILTRVD